MHAVKNYFNLLNCFLLFIFGQPLMKFSVLAGYWSREPTSMYLHRICLKDHYNDEWEFKTTIIQYVPKFKIIELKKIKIANADQQQNLGIWEFIIQSS